MSDPADIPAGFVALPARGGFTAVEVLLLLTQMLRELLGLQPKLLNHGQRGHLNFGVGGRLGNFGLRVARRHYVAAVCHRVRRIDAVFANRRQRLGGAVCRPRACVHFGHERIPLLLTAPRGGAPQRPM